MRAVGGVHCGGTHSRPGERPRMQHLEARKPLSHIPLHGRITPFSLDDAAKGTLAAPDVEAVPCPVGHWQHQLDNWVLFFLTLSFTPKDPTTDGTGQ